MVPSQAGQIVLETLAQKKKKKKPISKIGLVGVA
jgi:hypothetical protein